MVGQLVTLEELQLGLRVFEEPGRTMGFVNVKVKVTPVVAFVAVHWYLEVRVQI